MPVTKAWVVAVLAVCLVAGCGGDKNAERQALVDQEMKDCVDGFGKSRGGAAGLDGQRICDCAVGKLTEGKDAEQLRAMTQQTKANDEDLRTMGACVVEEARRKGVLSK
jgi:hypothetical protein